MKANKFVWVLLLTGVAAVKLPAQTLQTLCSFNGTNGGYPNALALGTDGNVYGTTTNGGDANWGTIFKVTTNGMLTTLYAFPVPSYTINGAQPMAGLTLGNDGNLYGTTYEGGSDTQGTVFRVTTNGQLVTLVSFQFTNGADPLAGLTLGNDGNFYGTTSYGGSGLEGTVFKVTTNGTLTTLASFTGSAPQAGLAQGNDGKFYGTTGSGGSYGTIFSVPTNGGFATLTSFYTGGHRVAGLTLGNDGNFYGATEAGGIYGNGTVFKVTTNGMLTTLASFNGTNGASPEAALTLGSDGNFYSTTASPGTIFKVTTNGNLTALAFFSNYSNNTVNTIGYLLQAGLTLGADGRFYGTTSVGGSNGYGSVFRLLFPPAINTQPQSVTNYVGATVTFSVSVTNLYPMNYQWQWQKNGTNLVDGDNTSGSTNSTLTIARISDSDSGNYLVIVSNSFGTVTSSNAILTLNDLPFIATQPLSQTIGVGSNVTFIAIAYGAPPFIFQWYYNNSPVGSPTSGTNVSSYTLTDVHTNQSGNYSVLVINGYDSVMSSNAVLAVEAFPPSISTQPSSQRAMIGSSVSFNVSVSGTTPFNYQWCFNSTNILDATNAIYAIQTVDTNNTGNYSVVITNSAGSVTSSNALLTVIVPPTVALQFLAGYPVLNLNGMLSNNFVVQYSTNLAGTNWVNLRSLTNLPASPYLFLDPAGIVPPARFYRALMQ